MITYSVAVHRIKTLEEMERDEAKLKKNALIEPKLIEKWNTWFQNNTYYKNHKFSAYCEANRPGLRSKTAVFRS